MLATQTQMTHVPYKGSGQAIIDLLAGQVELNFESPPNALQHIKAGKLKALAITSAKRSALLPDVPTIAEQGLPDDEIIQWFALLGPPGMPKPIVDKLNSRDQRDPEDARCRGEDRVAGRRDHWRFRPRSSRRSCRSDGRMGQADEGGQHQARLMRQRAMTLKTSDLCDACDEALACAMPFRSFGRRRDIRGHHPHRALLRRHRADARAVNQPVHDRRAGHRRRRIAGARDLRRRHGRHRRAQRLGGPGHPRRHARLGRDRRDGHRRQGAGHRAATRRAHWRRRSRRARQFGGVTFTPGRRLVADDDGVIVLPRA